MSKARRRAAWLLCAVLLNEEGRRAEAHRAYWNAVRPSPPATWFNGQPLMVVGPRVVTPSTGPSACPDAR